MEGHEPSLLLDIPPEIVSCILSYTGTQDVLALLWSTGSKALQAKIARLTTEVTIDVLKVPSKTSAGNFFPFLHNLRRLSVIALQRGEIDRHVLNNLVLVFQDVSPRLESLTLKFSDAENLVLRATHPKRDDTHRNSSNHHNPRVTGDEASANGSATPIAAVDEEAVTTTIHREAHLQENRAEEDQTPITAVAVEVETPNREEDVEALKVAILLQNLHLATLLPIQEAEIEATEAEIAEEDEEEEIQLMLLLRALSLQPSICLLNSLL